MRWITLAIIDLIILGGFFPVLLETKWTTWQRVTIYTALGYLLAVAWLTFSPVGLSLPDSYKPLQYFFWVPYNLHPLAHVDLEFAANILLTVPLGCYFYLLRPKAKWGLVLLLGVIPGLFIESTQMVSDLLFGTLRVVDIDDVITNTMGVWVGFFGTWLVAHTPVKSLVRPFLLTPAEI